MNPLTNGGRSNHEAMFEKKKNRRNDATATIRSLRFGLMWMKLNVDDFSIISYNEC